MALAARELFEILVREHASGLRAYLYALVHDESQVDDIFQETLLVAWKTIDRFDKTRPFGPWLRGIGQKVALASSRAKRRHFLIGDRQILDTLERRFADLHAAPGDIFDEKLDLLRACIQQLPEPYRLTIRRRYTDEVTGQSLAKDLGVTWENVKKRLQRARQMLHDCLTKKLAAAEDVT